MAAVTLLPASLQNAMQEIVERTSQSGAGIRAILLSTTEGVPLGRVYAGDEPLNEEVLATLESVWAPASKQIPSLGMEKVHQITAIYDHGTLIHVYQAPVVCVYLVIWRMNTETRVEIVYSCIILLTCVVLFLSYYRS
jgi:predicted regulator of Ras-like GTPase activity (Roadblock/LC7/MglB family)